MLTEPLPFGLRHREPERVFPLQPRVLQCLFCPCESRGGLGVPSLFSQLARQRYEEAEPILEVVELRLAHQPIPIQVGVGECHPHQRLDYTCVEVRRLERAKKQFRWIEALTAPTVGKPWISQRGQGRGRGIVAQWSRR